MPKGRGTYGKRRGRPKKKKRGKRKAWAIRYEEDQEK